jgi:hypothetical protein
MVWDEAAKGTVTKGQIMRLLKAEAEDFARADQSYASTCEWCRKIASLHRALDENPTPGLARY